MVSSYNPFAAVTPLSLFFTQLHPPTLQLCVFSKVYFVYISYPLVAAEHVVLDDVFEGVVVKVFSLQALLFLTACHQHLVAHRISREWQVVGNHL